MGFLELKIAGLSESKFFFFKRRAWYLAISD